MRTNIMIVIFQVGQVVPASHLHKTTGRPRTRPSSSGLLCRCRLDPTMTGGPAALEVAHRLGPLQQMLQAHLKSSSSRCGRRGPRPQEPPSTVTIIPATIREGTTIATEEEDTIHTLVLLPPHSHLITPPVATLRPVAFSHLQIQRTTLVDE